LVTYDQITNRGQEELIDVIFSDIDGCLVPQGYDSQGLIQTDEDSELYFDYYRNYPGPQLVLCTGRAWEHTFGILRRADFLPNQRRIWPDQPVLCENGMDVITDPVSGRRTSLVDELDELRDLRPVIEHIRSAGEELELVLGQMRRELEDEFGRNVRPIQLVKKEYCVTARIPNFDGTGQQVDAPRFLQSVTDAVQESLGSLVKKGQVRIILSAQAVDVTLPIGKGDGVKFLLEKYGTPASRAAFIGDSVPDVEGMQQVQLACCPSNAVPPVKAFVASLGRRGYVSPLAFADGQLDILNHIMGRG
jgi:hydroxymethylpyrimidine pyrophosphatase-like HAD family hydrolase